MKTIRGKIIVLLFVCLVFIGALTILYYWSVTSLENKLLIAQNFDNFLEDILEMRRYEKNFTYYKDVSSLNESVYYYFKIEEACGTLANDIKRIVGKNGCREFQDALAEYKRILERNMALAKAGSSSIDVEEFRARGKELVDFAENLIEKKRRRIGRRLKQIRVIPFAFLGSFVLLIIVILEFVARSILKPLSLLEKATMEAAKGTFRPIPYEVKNSDEVSQLIAAFNQMAHEIETRQEQLLQSRKMASIGTFTSGIAHELNNPINNISLIVESLIEDEETMDRHERGSLYQDLMEQAERSSGIVRNLLEFSRTDHPQWEEVALEELVEKTASLVKNQMRLNHIRYSKEVQGRIPTLNIDKSGIQQVLLNLFLNSIQTMKEGGGIHVLISHDNATGEVRVDVEDTGKGIPPDLVHRIFDPFFTTKKEGEGTGLGLSVSYNIIEKHGGRIEVQSKPGKGTCFSIFFPVRGGHGSD